MHDAIAGEVAFVGEGLELVIGAHDLPAEPLGEQLADVTAGEQSVLHARMHPFERGDVLLDRRGHSHGRVLVGEDEDAGENHGVRHAFTWPPRALCRLVRSHSGSSTRQSHPRCRGSFTRVGRRPKGRRGCTVGSEARGITMPGSRTACGPMTPSPRSMNGSFAILCRSFAGTGSQCGEPHTVPPTRRLVFCSEDRSRGSSSPSWKPLLPGIQPAHASYSPPLQACG